LSVSASVLGGVWQKLVILRRLFEVKQFELKSSGVSSSTEDFCQKLNLILDIAFFHSLKFSVFDTENSLTKLYQVLELYNRPYDLPKSLKSQILCGTSP
jgi:hypothetical protein